MAKIFGNEKKQSFQRNLFVGVARVTPLIFNPTKEQLEVVTKGNKAFENDIKYKFTDAQGGDSYKFDIWCKLEYIVGEDGNLVQPDIEISSSTLEGLQTDYVCLSWWGRNKPDIVYHKDTEAVKGAWYINSLTCEAEWVPENNIDKYLTEKKKTRLDYASPKTNVGIQGEKELYHFLERWLMIKEIDFGTPFLNILRGNYTEINTALKDNLARTDRTPRGIKVLLGVRETEDAAYQSVYSRLIMAENNNNYNKLEDGLAKYAWQDDKSRLDPSDEKSKHNFTLKFYSPEAAPAANTVVERPKPSQAGW